MIHQLPTINSNSLILPDTHGSITTSSGISSGYWTYPGASIISPGNTVQIPQNEIRIRKVKNGYICIVNNEEYVLTESNQVLKYFELIDGK